MIVKRYEWANRKCTTIDISIIVVFSVDILFFLNPSLLALNGKESLFGIEFFEFPKKAFILSGNDWKCFSFLFIWCIDRIGSDLWLLTTACWVIFSPDTYKSFSQKSEEGYDMTYNWHTISCRCIECIKLTCFARDPLLNPSSWSWIWPSVSACVDFFWQEVAPPWCLQSSNRRESRSFYEE